MAVDLLVQSLVARFDSVEFIRLINQKFSGNFAQIQRPLPVDDEDPWAHAEQLGIVKNLPGPNDTNRPLIVVAAELPAGEVLRERSSRLKQFRFAKIVLEDAVSNPSPDIEGLPSQGLFVFHDRDGNFRLSLVYATPKSTRLEWSTFKRYSFYVEAGAGNKTFRDRAALPWTTVDQLSDAFSVEKLTKDFYRSLFDWYQRAMDSPEVVFPNDIVTDKEPGAVKSEQIIRLITRLMFVWFLKQKHLVPDELFDADALREILKEFNPSDGYTYYRAILQNLFFATLNSEIPDRAFAADGGTVQTNAEHFDIKTLYRYGGDFAWPREKVLQLFHGIPFLNGGLFECLDRGRAYYDGFSREPTKQARVPNALFFDETDGLLPLLRQYNFTVEENSPGDEEVALDPELLGKVFENLLAAYNPETNVQARKATGSFYTPREIVNYMVDESLIAHLTTACGEEHETAIRTLFTNGVPPEDPELASQIDAGLTTVKVLDPACGSGAFPMGALLRMVDILRTVRRVPEDQSVYDLKLELIENAIYGADIQTIAVQISKLRFFISLIAEQQPNADAGNNYGIHSLPNLETKFVAANSLIGLPHASDALPMQDVEDLKQHLWEVRHRHFQARSYQEKKELRKQDQALRTALAEALEDGGGFDTAAAHLMAAWDPYDQNTSATFLDPEWMFNVRDGFDVVIGNPPYVSRNALAKQSKTFVEYAKEFYEIAQGRDFDLYALFIEKSVSVSSPLGKVCLIVPTGWYSGPGFSALRRFLVAATRIKVFINLPYDMFEHAWIDTTVFLVSKRSNRTKWPPEDPLRVKLKTFEKRTRILGTTDFQRDMVSVDARKWFINNSDAFLTRSTPETLEILDKITTSCRPFENVADIQRGVTPFKLTPTKTHPNSRRAFAGTLRRYRLDLGPERYVRYDNSLSEYKPERYFTGTRILLRELISRQMRLQACLTDETFVTNKSIQSLVPKPDIEAEIVLSILNSRLMSWYFLQMSNVGHRDDFPKIVLAETRSLPFPTTIQPNSRHKLTQSVREVLAIMGSETNPTADISALETEIDQLVYKLYDLTPEEIAIVEESTTAGSQAKQTPPHHTAAKKPPKKKPTPDLPPSLPGWD